MKQKVSYRKLKVKDEYLQMNANQLVTYWTGKSYWPTYLPSYWPTYESETDLPINGQLWDTEDTDTDTPEDNREYTLLDVYE